ncbi:MAG: hypothetical protein ACTSQJ_01095, partial [Promethearchaeota archaeon]
KKSFGFLFYGIEKEKLEKFNEMFTLLSSSASLYYRFIILLPPLFYTYFFKHPFPSLKYKPLFKNFDKLGEIAENVLELYHELKGYVYFEKNNFEYIEFGAELAQILKDKINLSFIVSNTLLKPDITKKEIDKLITMLRNFKERISMIKDKYEKLWLRAAKRPCLSIILNLFEFLIKCYDEKINQILSKNYFEDPYLSSEWIWVKETKCPPKPRYFKKVIEINQPVKKAVIQGIACNQMKIFINNNFVGEVRSRLSLSILPITQRVKIFDITDYLKEGKNVIAIEAYNYEGYKGAINIYGKIQLKDNSYEEIITDKQWICYKKEILKADKWKGIDFMDKKWKKVKSYGRPPNLNGDLFKTNILDGEKSITQDYFGAESYFYSAAETLLSGFIGYIAKKIGIKGIKLLKLYG